LFERGTFLSCTKGREKRKVLRALQLVDGLVLGKKQKPPFQKRRRERKEKKGFPLANL